MKQKQLFGLLFNVSIININLFFSAGWLKGEWMGSEGAQPHSGPFFRNPAFYSWSF